MLRRSVMPKGVRDYMMMRSVTRISTPLCTGRRTIDEVQVDSVLAVYKASLVTRD